VLGEPVLGAERLGDRLGDESGVAERGEPDPEDARLVLGDERSGHLEREPSLPRAAGAGEADKARAASDTVENLLELPLAADEGARRAGQVRVRDRLKRREGAPSELEDPHGHGDVLQAVLAEIGEREARVEKIPGRLGDDDLTAVSGGCDAGGEVDVVADVALLGYERCPRVQADPDLDRSRRERLGHLRSGPHRTRGRREGEEERIALRVHLDPAVRSAGRPDQAAVLGERGRVALRASSCRSLVEPSTSVKRKVTVPLGRSRRIDTTMMGRSGRAV
jgi:hypothetical protein